MDNAHVNIVPFELSHQPGIDLLFKSIEEEFPEQMFPDPTLNITKLSSSPGRVYWTAITDKTVVGTIGLLYLSGEHCCLKSMFLAKEFRSDKRKIANQLLQTAIEHANEHGSKMMCLGTMYQFKGAQRFYEKSGFTRIARDQLPPDFPANSVDTVFYLKML